MKPEITPVSAFPQFSESALAPCELYFSTPRRKSGERLMMGLRYETKKQHF
jgi:hypothetical protein